MIRALAAVLLLAGASEALACSCIMDTRTLEQKIDAAERVVLVRVVGAALESEPAPPEATLSERIKAGRIRYDVRVVESFKGAGGELPSITGSADTWGGGCSSRLDLAEDVLLFIEPGGDGFHASYCERSMLRLDRYPEAEPTLQAIRNYVTASTRIHECENALFPSPEFEESCKAHRDELLAPHRVRLRELRESRRARQRQTNAT